MALSEEVHGTGVETRGRVEYYGYDSLVYENPQWRESELLAAWTTRVNSKKDKSCALKVYVAKIELKGKSL